jgi:type IX secretion system PorP/SprF family membrane protein
MRNKLTYTILFLLVMTASGLMAQSDLLLSNPGINPTAYNPASITRNGMTNLHLLARQQWIGFPDAPSLQRIGAEHFFEDQSMGLKFNLMNQVAGKEITRQMNLSYAYRVSFSEQMTIHLGLSAGFYNRTMKFSELIFYDGAEPLIKADESFLRPDFEFGAEFHWKYFMAGLAANHITTPARKATNFKIPVHNHFYIGYRWIVSDEAAVQTNLSWHRQGTISQFQLDANLLFGNIFQAGLGLRSNDALIIHTGLNINEYVGIMYSYDLGINRFSNYNSGTHEFMLLLRLNQYNPTYLSPRFMD